MLLQDVAKWIQESMQSFAIQYGYLGIFLISLLGAMSIFVPIPYTVVIFILGGLPSFDPLWIAVAAGAGAAIGEFSGYLIGFGGRRVIGEKYKKKMDFLTKLFKKYGPIAIFIFALTPLPDDLLFIPLGVMRYSLIRAFIPALLGKFFSNLIIAYSGRLSLEIVKSLFGVEGEGTSLLIGTIIGIVLLVIVFIIMFKLDWEKHFAKYVDEPKDNAQTSEEAAVTKDK
ncbi:MAG: VTT domain-containing protein [Candidatus Bathyarchaeota archaeon]|nr:MAG: VTT domain-containing protein [Candidatus Bathyarchaeota archaeon]